MLFCSFHYHASLYSFGAYILVHLCITYNIFDMVQKYINDIVKGLFCHLLCAVYLGNLFMLIGIALLICTTVWHPAESLYHNLPIFLLKDIQDVLTFFFFNCKCHYAYYWTCPLLYMCESFAAIRNFFLRVSSFN